MLHHKKLLNSLIGRTRSCLLNGLRLLNTFYEKVASFSTPVIVINSWVYYRFGILKQRNWGDELNVVVVEALTGLKAVNKSDVYFNKEINYTVIGSLIPEALNDKTVIWGAGAAHNNADKLINRPLKVCAVRGKLTRDFLISNGIECPPIYGDPALLLPLIYPKENTRKYRLGLICHIDDESNIHYSEFLSRYSNDGVVKICLHDYGSCEEVINKICSCEVIASSSLHGLIVADAYNIPNIWLKSHSDIFGGEFKFQDYFSGVDRPVPVPVVLNHNQDLNALLRMADNYKAISFNHEKLIEACPFKIKIKCKEL